MKVEDEKPNLFERFVYGFICGLAGVFFGMKPIFWSDEWASGWVWLVIILLFFILGFSWGHKALRPIYHLFDRFR